MHFLSPHLHARTSLNWSGEYEAALAQLCVSNQALTFLLDELTTNTYNKNGKGLAERARRTAAYNNGAHHRAACIHGDT